WELMTRLASDSISKCNGYEIIAPPIGDERGKFFLAQAAGIIVTVSRDASLFSQIQNRPVENILVGDLRTQGLAQLAQFHWRAVCGRGVYLQHPLQNQPLQAAGVLTR